MGDIFQILNRELFFLGINDFLNRFCADHCLWPGHHFAVAVFTDNICVHVFRVNFKMLAEQVTKSCGVERCAWADDLSAIKTGQLPNHTRHNVYRVCSDQENTGKAGIQNRGDNALKYFTVALQQRNSVFARLLWNAGANDNNVRVCTIFIFTAVYFHIGFRERQAVVQVHCFAVGFCFINVDEHQFIASPVTQHCISKAHTDKAGTDNCDLLCESIVFHI